MSKYDESNINNIIKPINISGVSAALSQFAGIYDSKMMKEISGIARNPILTETQKMLGSYNKMRKLHMESFSMMGNLMANQTAWMKDYDFSGLKSFTENMSNSLGVNTHNIDGAIRVLNEMIEPLKISADFLKISGISANISGLSTILQEAGSSSLISQILKNNSTFSALSQKALEDVNINLLGRVTDQVFSEVEEWDIDTVSETIATEYEKVTDIPLNKENQDLPVTEKRKIDAKDIREWLGFIIMLISFFLEIMNSSSTTINNYNYNYTQQVNNYYVVGFGYDAKELNTTKYRIVNRESIVRLKHDCHSIVIEKLEEGQIVRIRDKYKKWRQIIWENEDGEECMGWIQNYKLTEFKMPRNK